MKYQLISLLILVLLQNQVFSVQRYVPTPNKESRNFVEWMKTVPADACKKKKKKKIGLIIF
jgi:hypothetical protein